MLERCHRPASKASSVNCRVGLMAPWFGPSVLKLTSVERLHASRSSRATSSFIYSQLAALSSQPVDASEPEMQDVDFSPHCQASPTGQRQTDFA